MFDIMWDISISMKISRKCKSDSFEKFSPPRLQSVCLSACLFVTKSVGPLFLVWQNLELEIYVLVYRPFCVLLLCFVTSTPVLLQFLLSSFSPTEDYINSLEIIHETRIFSTGIEYNYH